MLLLSFARIIKFGFQDIFRNIWLSLVTVVILILALFSINMLITVDLISKAAVNSVKEMVDVNLYLKPEAEESQILALKSKITALDQVKEVKYVSKADALELFKAKHKNNPEVLDALRELGKNPLTPTLLIKPKNIDEYDQLISVLNSISSEIIESRNFDDHKAVLTKINIISQKVRQAGIILSSIFVLITLLVVYNAIRVAIYTHRREIGIMRLVGASNWFIRAPFLISSVIYAALGCAAIVGIFYPFLTILQPYLEAFFIDYKINLLTYFNDNFLQIFGLEFLGALTVSGLASIIAVGKYSKV